MALAPLDGFTVGITAHRRWEEQAELLGRKGAAIVHGPVIRTVPLDDSEVLLARTDALITRPPDIVVLTTGIGVRAWMAAADASGRGEALLAALHGATLMARGPKALGAASTAGMAVTWAAETETGAEIVEHLARVGVTGRRVAVQRDGGQPELASALEQLGAEVVDVPVYRWTLPDHELPAARLIEAMCAGRLDAVTFTSAPAVSNVVGLAGERDEEVRAALAGPLVVACVGPVTAMAARAAGAYDVVEPTRARLGAMVQALAGRLAEQRASWRIGADDVVVQGAVVAVTGERVALSAGERGALAELTGRAGGVVTKAELLAASGSSSAGDHAAEVLVARLRGRLGRAGLAIEAVPRRGYRWRATAA